MKSVLISIQSYYVFLIIARIMGWDISQEKTVEVRKDFPKDSVWNKTVKIYCSKNRKSFNRIPKQYQPFMAKLLGKVIGEFVCDEVCRLLPNKAFGDYDFREIYALNNPNEYFSLKNICLTQGEIIDYGKGTILYGWHISDLKIYDKPKELEEFRTICTKKKCNVSCDCYDEEYDSCHRYATLTYPPRSWRYIGI